MAAELYEKVPETNSLRPDVQRICKKEDFVLGVAHLDEALTLGDEDFPLLFHHIDTHELFREIFECYSYCDPDQLEVLDSHASRLMENLTDKEVLLRAYSAITTVPHPWVVETLREHGFEVGP